MPNIRQKKLTKKNISEASQPSLGGDKEDGNNTMDKHDSPPVSPKCSINGKQKNFSQKSPTGQTTHWEESEDKMNYTW